MGQAFRAARRRCREAAGLKYSWRHQRLSGRFSSAKWCHDSANLARIKTGFISFFSFCLSAKSILVRLQYVFWIRLLFLTARASAVESLEILPKTGLWDPSSSHCCGFLTTRKFLTQGSVFQFLAPSEHPKKFFQIIPYLFQAWKEWMCPVWDDEKVKNARTTFGLLYTIWLNEWGRTKPSHMTDLVARIESHRLTPWTYCVGRFD